MSPPSRDGHSDEEGRDRRILPSFAQAFPSSPPPTRPQLRNALSDSPSTSSNPMPAVTESQKRKREDESFPIKNEEDEDVKVPTEQPTAGPSKRRRARKDSPSLSPPQPLQSRQNLPRPKHTLSGHSILNDTLASETTLQSPTRALPSTASFAVRRAALSSRKGAPSSLSINPPVQNAGRAKELGLEPTVRSAPPVPASRLRLHQLQAVSQPQSFQPSATGGVPSISRVRFGATYETNHPARLSQPPKTAGLMGSSLHTSGGGGIHTMVQPPTPSTAGPQSRSRDYNAVPLVPPTPSSLRHTLNQTHPPRSALVQSTPTTTAPDPRTTAQIPQPHPKQAFLQPFEAFYDALNDARALKEWLSEQLTRSNALLQQQQPSGGSMNVRQVEDIIDQKLKGFRNEVEYLKDRVFMLEDVLARNGIAPPPATANSLQSSLSRSNGSVGHNRSPGTKRDRDLPPPISSGNVLRDPYPQHLKPTSSSPSVPLTVLPPASSLTKMSTSSSRLDPLPARAQYPPAGRGGRVPSPLGGSPISENDERRENRKSQEDRDERMNTT